jgi:exosortase H (IPTLxxWG-CTERM-specific)
MARFLTLFLTVLLVLFLGELTPPAQHWVVVPWTAALADFSATLVQFVDPAVSASGRVLQNARTGVGISIEAGCNGIEACIMLVAAVVAYRARWREKLPAVVLGMLAIQSLNVLRIISLFYLVQWNQQVFQFTHLYLWQALIMLDVLLVWLLWLRWVARREFAGGPAPMKA